MSGIRRNAVGVVVAVLVLLSGCSGGAPDGLAFESEEEAARILETYAVELDFHASWLCELQRRTFLEFEDIEKARSEALVGAGLSDDRYGEVLHALADSQAARDYVRTAHNERCEA